MDPGLVVDKEIKQQLLDGGMDDRLATHFAHLFIRDPIVIFDEDLTELDMSKADHFENLQSTNWQHMRFKPPPAGSNIGWRVEFRPMEIQMTDFENAAFAVFIVLVTRTILSFDLNFYVPIARVDENMETAHVRDALGTRKFHFRKDPFPPVRLSGNHHGGSSSSNGTSRSGYSSPAASASRPATPPPGPVEDEYGLMTIDEIINGTAYALRPRQDREDADEQEGTGQAGLGATPAELLPSGGNEFPGLIPLVETYLDSMNVDATTRCQLGTYLNLISRRASGELWTAAKWIRHFVATHPEYCQDSAVTEKLTKDLVGAVIAIGEREQSGAGFRGLDIPGFTKLMNGFRCGE